MAAVSRHAPRRRRRGVARTLLVALLAAGIGIALPVSPARADGDPASDVLVAAPPLFLPPDSGASYPEQAALVAQLRSAARPGHRLRVAVIASRADLGSVGALWNRPEAYAEFLGRELSLDYRGELLVVMPDGFGVVREDRPVATALDRLAPRRGRLLTAAEQAVQRLTGVSVGTQRIAVAAAPSRTAGTGWWLATVIALAAVAGAWSASLRARGWRAPAGH